MARRPVVTAATVGVVALAVACGPVGRPADDRTALPTSSTPTGTSSTNTSPTGSSSTTGSSTRTSDRSPTPSKTATKARPTRVAWVPFGPASPNSPPPFGWYGALEDRDCDGLRSRAENDPTDEGTDRVRPIYLALAYACSAAVEGNQGDWTLAVSAADGVDRSVDYSCLDGAALGLLDRLVAAHTSAPDLQVRLREGRGTACPFEVTAVEVLGADGPVPGPASGPVSGGTTVQVRGKGFVDVTAVRFGDVEVGVGVDVDVEAGDPSLDDDTLTVTAPPAAAPGAVRVVVEGPAGEAASGPDAFTYTEDATGSGG